MITPDMAETIAQEAVRAFQLRGREGLVCLDTIATAAYATDDTGQIIYFNPAAVDFAGRSPVVGVDRWCVTWKLYTERGDFLPHEQCPMAEAIRKKEAVRGATAVAERPDGSRKAFMPLPSPVLDQSGNLVAAINVFVDITAERLKDLEEKARRARRLAKGCLNNQIMGALLDAAEEYESAARALRHKIRPARLRT